MLIAASCGIIGQASAAEPSRSYDLLIRQGRVVDGTGAPWYVADIAIKDGTIVAIGHLHSDAAAEVIDASGLVVAPGFIDMMGQTASPLLEDPKTAMNLLAQGITTINAGEGSSAAPLSGEEALRAGWSTMAEYFQLIDLKGLPVNVAQSVGHTQIRRLVMGDEDRRPSDEELEAMQQHVREAMQAGAIGVSTALIYPPAIYAQTQEIAALAKIAGEFGGRYYTHMRNEGDLLLEAIDEAIEIGRSAATPVHIFHLKAAGRQNWGKMDLALARIKAARAEGQQVTADVYPYVNNGLYITALVHPRHFAAGQEAFTRALEQEEKRAEIRQEMEEVGGWENWYRHVGRDWDKIVIGQTSDRRYAPHAGKSLAKVAEACGEQPWDTFFGLLRAGAFVLPQSMSEANVIAAIGQPFISFCTDVGPSSGGEFASHPRGFGAFPRLFSRYVRGLGVISLEQAVSQATSVAANDLMAFDRGRLAIGQAADIIAFDYDEFTDRADFSSPHELAEGMRFVIVNGEVVLKQGEFTGKLPGRVLRGPGYDANKSADKIMTGPSDPALSVIDEAMQRVLREHRLPGMSLAITREGRLVHSRGYGYADVASAQPVERTSLFRIASISKPITAVAILQLVEQGKLSLEERVLETLGLQPPADESNGKFDPRQREITIRHLLQHRGGWDRDQSFDAMFQSVKFAQSLGKEPPAKADDVIQAMLTVPLDFDPGERYAYSNYGYCLLGRVIEKLSGQSYEQYVKQRILTPLGIESMCVGCTRLAECHAHEVRYYHPETGESVFAADLGKKLAAPYGAWYLEAMDSHGGWIATAEDLVRFAAALDRPDASPLLSADSIRLITERPPGSAGELDIDDKDVFYGLGWVVREHRDGTVTMWHGGSLPGTNTELARRRDGTNIALLINARVSAKSPRVINDAMKALHQAIDSVGQWPEHDLFKQ